ncbi:DUF7059 domain-containing protein [Propionibacteriaceae bacterium Y2011]
MSEESSGSSGSPESAAAGTEEGHSPGATGGAHGGRTTAPVAPPDAQLIATLRDALTAGRYTVDAVNDRLGPVGQAALGRNHTLPGSHALGSDDDPQATLIRLWPLQSEVSTAAVERALPGMLDALVTAGVLHRDGDRIRSAVDLAPYDGDDGTAGWIVSDHTPGMDGRIDEVGDDYVLGVSSASVTLAQIAARNPVGRALDLGSGCGVQSLHLARHADHVVATDLNRRAVTAAAWTFALNDVAVELRHGDLWQPVAGETFDQVISNPPYVMSPPGTAHLTYRESSLPGDDLVRTVALGAADRLNPGGTAQVLANWIHPADGDWRERLAGWFTGSGCAVHVVQREVLDPAEYAEMWLLDAGLQGGPRYRAAYEQWLRHLASTGVAGIGMGWILLYRSESDDPDVTIEHWPSPVAQPVGDALAQRPGQLAVAVRPDDQLLGTRLTLADDVLTETLGPPGAADPSAIVLVQHRGLCRRVQVDTALAGVVGACDGELAVGQLIAAVAGLLDEDETAVTHRLLPRLRELISYGMLIGGPA